MGVDISDAPVGGPVVERRSVERFYFDDDLFEDYSDAVPQAARLPVVRIERGDQRRGLSRPFLWMFAGVMLAVAVSVFLRSRGTAHGHGASSPVPRVSGSQHSRTRVHAATRSPSRPSHSIVHRRARYRLVAARRAGDRLAASRSTSPVTLRVVYAPASPSAPAPPRRNDEFGFER
jgi:hypothetical protein